MARPVTTMPVMDAWPAWRRRLWGHLTSGYARVDLGLRRVWQRATHAAAVDRTATAADRPCLVLAPHADDETLGCGALIARKRASGTPVWVVVATDGRVAIESAVMSPDELADLRRAEARRACAILGVEDARVTFLDHPDRGLSSRPVQLDADLRRVLDGCAPEEVYVTWERDPHPDHRALSRAARRCLSDRPQLALIEYPVWAWVQGPWAAADDRGRLRRGVDLLAAPVAALVHYRAERVDAGHHRTYKEAAMRAYASQTTNLTGEPGWITLGQAVLDELITDREVFFRRRW